MLTALSKASIPIDGDLRSAASASHWSPGLQSIVAARRTRSIVTFATPEKCTTYYPIKSNIIMSADLHNESRAQNTRTKNRSNPAQKK